VSGWSDVFLGVIALATLAIAVGQVGLFVALGRALKRVERLAERVDSELKPVFGHLDAIGRDAARATSLAAAQVERADRLFADLAVRVDDTLNGVQSAVGSTAREGAAVLAGLRAALAALKDVRERRSRTRADEEDALFI
jgi:hypothetical protein